jgi:hypothetical protein
VAAHVPLHPDNLVPKAFHDKIELATLEIAVKEANQLVSPPPSKAPIKEKRSPTDRFQRIFDPNCSRLCHNPVVMAPPHLNYLCGFSKSEISFLSVARDLQRSAPCDRLERKVHMFEKPELPTFVLLDTLQSLLAIGFSID